MNTYLCTPILGHSQIQVKRFTHYRTRFLLIRQAVSFIHSVTLFVLIQSIFSHITLQSYTCYDNNEPETFNHGDVFLK